jgi:hypothetical protein
MVELGASTPAPGTTARAERAQTAERAQIAERYSLRSGLHRRSELVTVQSSTVSAYQVSAKKVALTAVTLWERFTRGLQ